MDGSYGRLIGLDGILLTRLVLVQLVIGLERRARARTSGRHAVLLEMLAGEVSAGNRMFSDFQRSRKEGKSSWKLFLTSLFFAKQLRWT